MFGETDPIGKTFRIDRGFGEKEYKEYSVIGVVGDAKYGRLRADIRPTIFMSVPLSTNRLYLHVRTYGDPAAALPVVRRAIAEIDPDLPIMEEQSATKDIDDQLVRERLLGSLYGFFGVAALAFAALALYSTMSSAIHLRTSELGLRLAIGASPASIAALVTREALKILALGMVLGLPLTWAAANWIAGELYGVSPHDLPAFAISSGIVTVVATLAVVGPALWAVRVEPMTALRHQ